MKAISEIIDALRELQSINAIRALNVHFNSPSLYIDIVATDVINKDYDSQLEIVSKLLSTQPGFQDIDLSDYMSRLPVVFSIQDESNASDLPVEGETSWVSAFLDTGLETQNITPNDKDPKFVHFYGYKGGQGRSTVLALLAEAMANDGYKILVIDADIEAPSLDHLFNAAANSYSQTLMGLCGWANEVEPIGGVHIGRQNGRIDLLPCRPRIDGSDLDFSLMVASAPLDSDIYRKAGRKLRNHLQTLHGKAYDMVFIDHRTGIASSVLPLMETLPGSSAIFARPDMNISSVPSELKKVIRAIVGLSCPIGASSFVGFSLDPNRRSGIATSDAEARIRSELMDILIDASETSEGDLIFSSELGVGWVDWYLDRALLGSGLPEVEKLQVDNLSALKTLRDYLGLPLERSEKSTHNEAGITSTSTSVSGARDGGAFIHIPEIESLLISGNPYTYILGRKGTGKTRLLNEMSKRGLGVPILVAADENTTTGLQSQSVEAEDWLLACNHDPAIFWWSLLHIAIDNNSQKKTMAEILAEKIADGIPPTTLATRTTIKNKLLNSQDNHTFLIDGLETLVSAERIKAFVGSLFDVMGAIQNDPAIARKLTIRMFVREDLASDVVQNVEQQIEGRNIRLKWSISAILNFAISRIPTLDWIGGKFSEMRSDILARWDDIEKSALSETESTELLLKIFPARLRRNNLSTATFLKLYFSDAGGDDTNKSTFYPRLYLSFLQKLDKLAASADTPISPDGKLDSALLNQAYDEASGDFINETKQELTHLLSLQYDPSFSSHDDDAEKVVKFISAFDGLSTPFALDSRISELYERTRFTQKSIRESLQRMKAIRMFEERPGYEGWWRVGQLYKRGLRMKYVRNNKQ